MPLLARNFPMHRSRKLIDKSKILVDPQDAHWLHKADWYFNGNGYPIASMGVGKQVFLHRLIVDAPPRTPVDHKNGDVLDCRRQNLRICTPLENARNRRVRRDCAAGLKGVSFDKRKAAKPWRANIVVEGKRIDLGVFPTSESAYAAYCAAAKRFFGDFARI